MKFKWKNIEIPTILFLITNALFFLCGIHTFSKISMKATILSCVIASFFAYIVLSLFLFFAKEKTMNLSNLSKPIAIIIIFALTFLLNYSLTRITGFITYNVVRSIPYYLFIALFLLTCIFTVYKGFHAITRSAFIYFLTIILFTFITFIALFPKMDFQNVLPLVDTDFKAILKSAGLYTLIILSPYFYLSFFNVQLTKDVSISLKKGFWKTQIFLIFYILIIFSILGIHITNIYPYPEVSIFKKVSFLNIVDRMESVFSISYFLSLFIHFSITLYGIINLLSLFIPKEKRVISLFIVCFLLFLMNSFYKTSLFVWFICCFLLLLFFCFTFKSRIKK